MEQKLIDFTNCTSGNRSYGGTDSKLSVSYNNQKYMLKFPEYRTSTTEIQTSHVNNVFSEYIGSHIVASLNLETHKTLIGVYKGEPVVACLDFVDVENGWSLQEFKWFMMNLYRPSEIGRIPTYKQIYYVIQNHPQLKEHKQQFIEAYWDTFICDALIGNFDRHKGNWGYLVNDVTGEVKLAPIYDCGSSLYPGLAENSLEGIMSDEAEINMRIFEFPKAALNKLDNPKKIDKYGYYELINSGIDDNCTNAYFRIYPRIDLDKINKIIEDTPLISPIRKKFYKTMIKARYEKILVPSYTVLLEKFKHKTPKQPRTTTIKF